LFLILPLVILFVFNIPATTETYTLSLHDALPISESRRSRAHALDRQRALRASFRHPHDARLRAARAVVECRSRATATGKPAPRRSEEHTSELQSRGHLVCRLLLEKKKNNCCYVSK